VHKEGKMVRSKSTDPRSVRARNAFREALKALLKKKTFSKISVTEICNEAGLARHTFYNHYESKEALLNSILDGVLTEYFSGAADWNIFIDDPERQKEVAIRFFEVWEKHSDIIDLLCLENFDQLLINRLVVQFQDFYDRALVPGTSAATDQFAKYIIRFNAYAFVGFLRQWIEDDMKYSAELVGELADYFAGIQLKNTAIRKFAPSFNIK
jgi:AcrR family transcriptional regulator